MEMELIDRITADRGKSCKHIAGHACRCIGHHATVGEATAVDALAVNAEVGCDIVDDGFEEVDVFAVFSRCMPSRKRRAEDREEDILTLRIGNNAANLVGNRCAERRLVGSVTTGAVKTQYQRSGGRYLVGDIKPIGACHAIYRDSSHLVGLSICGYETPTE